jgi:hypothetical protein
MRWKGHDVTAKADIGTYVRLAYADPPYLGCAALYDHFDAARWDDPEAHLALMRWMEHKYDGWALSASSPSLRHLLPGAPARARVAAWVKPFAAYKRNVRIAYTWEPVIFAPGRDRSADGAPVGRDHLSTPITLRRGMTGAKPAAFCRWVLDLLGYLNGDELTDLFPGTGVMGRVLDQGRLGLTEWHGGGLEIQL